MPIPATPSSRSFPWFLEGTLVRAWCGWAGIAVLVSLLVDGVTVEFRAAGRVFLGSILIFHFIVVPGLRSSAGLLGRSIECLALGLLVLPVAEVVRGLTGAPRSRLLLVGVLVVVGHAVGSLAERVGRGHPAALRYGYWPWVVILGAVWPVLGYLGTEFLGRTVWPWPGGLFGPFLTILDG